MSFAAKEILESMENNILRLYMEDEGYSVFRNRLLDYLPELYTHLMDLYGDRSDLE